MSRQIVVDIVGDSSKFNAATRSAVGSANSMDKGFRGSAVGGAIAGATFSVVTKALDFVGEALGNASASAKEDTASQDRLALAYKNTGKAQGLTIAAIENVISANQAKGVSDSEQRQGISDFLDLTNDATKAMTLNQATIELAAAKGIAYSAAEDMIKSAAAGKAAALKKAGVEIEKGASITEIATAVNAKFGGSLDAVAQTQSGKASIANEKMGEAMERVGRIINDIATVVVPILLGAFADTVGFIMDNIVPVISQVADVVLPILSDAFKVLAPIAMQVFGIIKDAVTKAIAFITPIIKSLMPVFKTVFGVLGDVIKTLAPIFKTVFGAIGVVLDIAGKVFGVVFDAFGKAIGVFGGILGGLGSLVGNVFGVITGIVKGAINGVISIINSVIGAINSIQVHIHVGPVDLDWNGLSIPRLPKLHTGGIVPGAVGSEVPIMALGGERVSPLGGSGGTEVHIHIEQGAYIDGPSIDRLSRLIATRMSLQGIR